MWMALLTKTFLLFFAFVYCFDGDILDFNVKMKFALLNEGFHRNLTYGIVFNANRKEDRWLYEDCAVGLEQELPPGVYANPDELWDLARMQKLDAVPRNRVNIESPAEQSYPTSIYITGKIIDGKAYLWLPVHTRYHAAVTGGGRATNTISSPKLFIRCREPRGKWPGTPETAMCNGSSKQKCRWKELAYTMMSPPIKWEVPVGNLSHYYVVSIGTASVIVIGSLYLIRILHEYNVSVKKKLQ